MSSEKSPSEEKGGFTEATEEEQAEYHQQAEDEALEDEAWEWFHEQERLAGDEHARLELLEEQADALALDEAISAAPIKNGPYSETPTAQEWVNGLVKHDFPRNPDAIKHLQDEWEYLIGEWDESEGHDSIDDDEHAAEPTDSRDHPDNNVQ